MIRRVFIVACFAVATSLSSKAQDASVPAEGVAWKPFMEAVALAGQESRMVIVDIYAPWCPWCRRLQREVYTDAAVQENLEKHFIATRLDGENQTDSLSFKDYTLTPAELAQGLGAQGYPTTVFLDANGDYITRLPGFVEATEFTRILSYVGTEAFKTKSYQDYVEKTND